MAIPVKFIGDKIAKQMQAKAESAAQGGDKPRLVHQPEFNVMQPLNTFTKVRINNMFWANTPIASGTLFITSQGQRLVLEANHTRVLYVLLNPTSYGNNQIYVQKTRGFVADVVYYPMEDAGRKLQIVKKIAEYEMQTIIGILSVTSWGAFAAVFGTDVMQFIFNNQNNFPRWERIARACFQTRKDLKKYAPVLYDKLLYSTLLVAWQGTRYAGGESGKISDAVSETAIKDPRIAGRGAGIILGKIGIKAMNGRITVLSVVWTILLTVTKKAMSAIPETIKNATEDFKKKQTIEKAEIAVKLLEVIKKSDIHLSKEEAETIVLEVYEHPKELAASIENLTKAFNNDK